jgi:hypothetical protein
MVLFPDGACFLVERVFWPVHDVHGEHAVHGVYGV